MQLINLFLVASLTADWNSVEASPRYKAACAALRAVDGKKEERVPSAQHPELRRQARDWLQADLTCWQWMVKTDLSCHRDRVHARLRFWSNDPRLACIRNPERLRELYPDEQLVFERFWRDVKVLYDRTAPPELVPAPRVFPASK